MLRLFAFDSKVSRSSLLIAVDIILTKLLSYFEFQQKKTTRFRISESVNSYTDGHKIHNHDSQMPNRQKERKNDFIKSQNYASTQLIACIYFSLHFFFLLSRIFVLFAYFIVHGFFIFSHFPQYHIFLSAFSPSSYISALFVVTCHFVAFPCSLLLISILLIFIDFRHLKALCPRSSEYTRLALETEHRYKQRAQQVLTR